MGCRADLLSGRSAISLSLPPLMYTNRCSTGSAPVRVPRIGLERKKAVYKGYQDNPFGELVIAGGDSTAGPHVEP
jgi:hypothetical protein